MIKTFYLDDSKENIEIVISLPMKQSGAYLLDKSSKWTVNNLCVVINRAHGEYTLNQQIYLDYKDSLQVGEMFLSFDSEEQAELFAKKYGLEVCYYYYN